MACDTRLLPAAWLLGLMLTHAACMAQWSGSVSWLSDERFRGESLSHSRPALEADLNIDHDSGLYAGSLLSGGPVNAHGALTSQQLYAGLARPLGWLPLTWDVGAVRYRYFQYEDASAYNYTEAYAAVHAQRWNVRVAHTPSYYGKDAPATYVDTNAWQPMGQHWRLSGHVGWLTGPLIQQADTSQHSRLDVKAGISYTQDALTLSFAVVDVAPRRASRPAAIMSATQRF